MSKFLVTLGASTGPGSIIQCSAVTATINKKPIAVVGDIATHPYGPDTLIEGMPTVLLNGKPVVFSTAKTSKGGAVVPNTTVKISSPTFESYTGIVHSARIKSNLHFDEPTSGNIKEKELKKQIAAREEEEPVESGEVTLESDFAWKQLIDLAVSDGKWMFKFRMADIFGKDVSQNAVDKLYDDCQNKSLSNPEIQVCENRIYGLMAAYNQKTNKIYVSRRAVEEAIEDNEKRHKLMVALVEEFGHHVDWLLRCQYDKNANNDAEGDEGARFAYRGMCRVLYLDFHELQSVPFANAQTPEGAFALEWDIAEAHNALEKYTKDRQYGTDDHVGGYEGFKVEDLSKQGGFGHENIQRDAIRKSGIDVLRKETNIQYLYRGNWLKDFAQLIAPFLFDPSVFFEEEDTKEKLKNFYNEMVPDRNELKKFLEDVVRLLAIQKFYAKERGIIQRKVYYEDPTKWRLVVDDKDRGLIPGFDERIGVSVPYDHCDNPKGLCTSEILKDMGFNGEITSYEISINDEKGIKQYIRSNFREDETKSWGTKVIYNQLDEQLKEIDFTEPSHLVRLGGALHTIQDFYAHSNYAEVSLVKVWFDKVVTWCAESDRFRDYSLKRIDYFHIDKGMIFDEEEVKKIISRKDDVLRAEGNKMRWKNGGDYFYKKALYTPVVTGTYDLEDMMATASLMLANTAFSLELPPPKKGMKPGVLYGNDLILLLLCRYFDKTRNNTEIKTEEYLNKFFDLRDYWLEIKMYIDKKMPDWVKAVAEWIEDNIIRNIEQALRLYENIIKHYVCVILATYIREYQLVLKQQLKDIKASINGMYPHGDNPSHTMLAKDEASHPVNSLAGQMAIDSTVSVLKALNNKTLITSTLDNIIVHPLLVHHFDAYTRQWAKDNPIKVLKCCVYSAQLETIRVGIQLTEKAKHYVNKLYNNSNAIGTNRAAKSSSEKDALSQEEDLNAIGKHYKDLCKLFKEALGSYDMKYRELDAQTFVEFLSLYYPKIERDDSLSDALKQIWREACDKATNKVKGSIKNSFDFIANAYNQAVAYLES